MKSDNIFLRTCNGEIGEKTPIWLMRQAGRYLDEYRVLRKRDEFFKLCTNPERIKEITLMPIKRFALDAAIIFSDITLPLHYMGKRLKFEPGPVFETPVKTAEDLLELRMPQPSDFDFLGKGIQLVKKKLSEDSGNLPLIGFGGAPFTLASYLIEGGHSKDFLKTKRFMWQNEEAFREFMEMMTESIVLFLNCQIDKGVDAVQLFDTWAGVLSPQDYREFALPYTKKVYNAIKEKDMPFIHFLRGSSHLLPYMKEAGDVMSIDWTIELREAMNILGNEFPIQGNLDPALLLAPKEILIKRIEDILIQGKDAPHIFNLGHGILPDTRPDIVEYLIKIVHSFKKRGE